MSSNEDWSSDLMAITEENNSLLDSKDNKLTLKVAQKSLSNIESTTQQNKDKVKQYICPLPVSCELDKEENKVSLNDSQLCDQVVPTEICNSTTVPKKSKLLINLTNSKDITESNTEKECISSDVDEIKTSDKNNNVDVGLKTIKSLTSEKSESANRNQIKENIKRDVRFSDDHVVPSSGVKESDSLDIVRDKNKPTTCMVSVKNYLPPSVPDKLSAVNELQKDHDLQETLNMNEKEENLIVNIVESDDNDTKEAEPSNQLEAVELTEYQICNAQFNVDQIDKSKTVTDNSLNEDRETDCSSVVSCGGKYEDAYDGDESVSISDSMEVSRMGNMDAKVPGSQESFPEKTDDGSYGLDLEDELLSQDLVLNGLSQDSLELYGDQNDPPRKKTCEEALPNNVTTRTSDRTEHGHRNTSPRSKPLFTHIPEEQPYSPFQEELRYIESQCQCPAGLITYTTWRSCMCAAGRTPTICDAQHGYVYMPPNPYMYTPYGYPGYYYPGNHFIYCQNNFTVEPHLSGHFHSQTDCLDK